MSFAKALVPRVRPRVPPRTPPRLRVLLRPARGRLRLRGDAPQHHARDASSAGPASVWRYADLLPVDPAYAVDINAGFTPLIRAKNLGEHLGLKNLYIKNDCANPTWSFKDRVVTVAATKAREFGFKTLACASTGNLANSVSAHAARAGLEAYVFIPSDLERGKIVGSSVYGATLVAVDGNYDDVNRLCCRAGRQVPLGLRQHQHAAVLRRGLARRWATRSPSSSAGARRSTSSRRWRPARST